MNLQAYQWTATGLKAYDRNLYGVAQYCRIDYAEQEIERRNKLLQRFIDLCALGDVDETTDEFGWGALIAEAKRSLA